MTTIIVISAILIFSIRTIFFYKGLKKTRSFNISFDEHPYISILVPARNEEHNLEACVNSILNLNYPKEKFELIIINDRSTDKTEEIAKRFADKHSNIKLVKISSDHQKGNIKGKAGAIHFGIQNASHDLLLMTDADCTVEPTWAAGIAGLFVKQEADMIASFSVIKADSLLYKLEELQWLYMNCMASGSSGNNFLLGCYGNNQSFRKSKYEALGGYEKINFTVTEDLALLQAFDNNGFKILYPCDPNLLVWTKPVGNIKDYFKQLHRWTRGGKELGYKAFLFVITSFSLWFAALYSLFTEHYLHFLIIFFSRLALDSLLMIPALSKLKLKNMKRYILVGVPFLLFLELISPIMLLKKKVSWKGQVFK